MTSTGFTLQANVKYGGGSGLILDKGTSTSDTEQFGLGVYDGDISFWVHDEAENWPTLDGETALPTGEWHTVTVVVDDSEMRLFLDDQEIGSLEHSISSLMSSEAPVVLGGNDLDVSVKSTNALGTALSASEVADGLLAPPSSAVLWLTYDEVVDTAIEWREEQVPGQWGYNGYFDPEGGELAWYHEDGEYGWYRRDFDVPTDMQDGRIKLRFDAVYSEAWVSLNGTQVTHHVGGYSPFEVDVTDEVNADGTNTLFVQVSQRSAANDVGWQNVTGGITRDVSLVGVPEAHLGECYVTTSIGSGGSTATVSVETAVENTGSAAVEGATVSATLTGPGGSTAATAEQSVTSVTAGSSQSVTFDLSVDDPALWNPEQPHLYSLDVELEAGGETETVTERVGIREVAVDGNDLLLNGESVTLRGVNWEEIHLPKHGHAVPEAITREDARRLKAANVNYVRTSHHPVSEAFIEACDEFGIVVEEEAPMMFLGSNRLWEEDEDENPTQLSDPYPDVIVQQVLEMIERDRNRPSICLWSVANESQWFDVFETVAALVEAVDPTRPTIFNYDAYSADDVWHDMYDIRSMHYPAFRSGSTIEQTADLDEPVSYGEYAHTYCYNDAELVTDPGLRDQWGHHFQQVWETVRDADAAVAAALWAGGDHLEQWGEYYWGMLDRHRRPRPEYWHVKKTYAPVRVTDATWNAAGTSVTVTIENRHEFVTLSERTIEWTTGGRTRELSVDLPAGEATSIDLDVSGGEGTLTVTHPQGHTVNEIVLSSGPEIPSMPGDVDPDVSTDDRMIEISTEAYTLGIDETDGTIEFGTPGESPLVVDGPELVLTPVQSEAGRDYASTIDHRRSGRTVSDVSLDGSTVVLDVAYDSAEGTFRIQPVENGLEIEYDFSLLESVAAREVGIALPATTDLTMLSWRRDGLWDTYPEDHIGRTTGTASAFPSGSRPSNEGIEMQAGQPWKDDETVHGSNDFRSTKRNVYRASLTDDSARGLAVLSAGDQHVRTQARSGHVDFLVLDRTISGTNAYSWLNRHPVLNEEPTLESGTDLQGSVTVTLGETRDGDGEEDGEDEPVTLPGADGPSQDLDGDGLYEDVNGDGRTDINDVRSLLNNRRSDAVRTNADAYDFDGDGDVTVGDVLALFRDIV